MKSILVIGAGKSAVALIQYLLDEGERTGEWMVRLVDKDGSLAQKRIGDHSRGEAGSLDIQDEAERRKAIEAHDLVISMLPARMHVEVVKDCIEAGVDVITPSYVSEELQALDGRAREAGVLVLNEMGLDPGIDHMSAMKVIDTLREKGCEMTRFESFAGGLVAPDSDDNPWGYKITWDPMGVIMAAQGGPVKFKQRGRYKYIPSHQVFRRFEHIHIEGYGRFEGYPNRDSLKYRKVYGLEEVPTIFRGTLRRPGFCRAWDSLVQLGATDDRFIVEGSEQMTYRQFINSFLAYHPTDSVELKLMHYLGIDQGSQVMEKLKWLGLFDNEVIGIRDATPADILRGLLEHKWAMTSGDKDMIVLYHRFGFMAGDEEKQIDAWMVTERGNDQFTAMANAVGLPLGIVSKLMLRNGIDLEGVHRPIESKIYQPVLEELRGFGMGFHEQEVEPIVD